MISPSLTLPFADQYFNYSMHLSELEIPPTCHTYLPDNEHDFACRILVQPAPEFGAPHWTASNGKRLLLGIYRDQGRPAAVAEPKAMAWTRSGITMTIVVPQGGFQPYFKRDDQVNLFNVNVPTLTAAVTSAGRTQAGNQAFICTVPNSGALSGTGSFQPVAPVNFYEDYVVFRLLPSMRVMLVSEAMALLNSFKSTVHASVDELVDSTTGLRVRVSRDSTSQVLFDNGSTSSSINRQQYAENKHALQQTYDILGRPIPSRYRSNPKQNLKRLIDQSTATPDGSLDVYDFYGFALNDITRGPFMASDLVSYDAMVVDNLHRKLVNARVAYAGPIYDEFGLTVIGAVNSDQTIIRDPIYPLEVDQLNVPFKEPNARGFVNS